ncbi:MAG: hypothetical protein IPF93_11280 [Saprospiraceae bacterium]|nr:hypothetical protein [Saprospiraceae bacterium]
MITDGKPTCIKIGKKYYKNAFGMDLKIVNRTLALALVQKLHIPVTTFVVARDFYLAQFVDLHPCNNGNGLFTARWILGRIYFYGYKGVKETEEVR